MSSSLKACQATLYIVAFNRAISLLVAVLRLVFFLVLAIVGVLAGVAGVVVGVVNGNAAAAARVEVVIGHRCVLA